MTWVLIYFGIALAGLIMVGCFAIWLWRQALALLREFGALLARGDELAGILEQIGQPADSDHPGGGVPASSGTAQHSRGR